MLFRTAASLLVLAWASGAAAQTQAPSGPATPSGARADKPADQTGEIIVTAQKREQKIQSVGMSIQAVTGDVMLDKGINSLGDLTKLIPGLRADDTGFRGPPGVAIRGVSYHDASLAASPTVTIYNDQAPLPFSIEGLGSTLDLQRVEVLKGPQGTLFGDNSTGGAINYIANKPTDHFEAGAAVQYGTFNTVDAQGYVSGPLASTLDARLALRTVQADGWQKNYINGATLGARNFTTGRFTLEWKPTNRLTIVGTLSGFIDRSQTPAPQFEGLSPLSPSALPVAGVISFPIAPNNARAAAFPNCINDSPNDTHCVGYNRNNRFYMGALRADYDLGNSITLTSLTSYEKYLEYQPLSQDGTTYQDYQSITGGHLTTFYQELRLSGDFSGKGAWIIGGNYQNDNTAESDFATVADSSSAKVLGIPVIALDTTVAGVTKTYAGFVHAEYPVFENVTVEGGVRATQSDQSFAGCLRDDGNGMAATAIQYLQNYLITGGAVGPGINAGPGGCVTMGPGVPISVVVGPPLVVTPGHGYVPGLVHDSLDEQNVSFRFGVNWKVTHDALLYANVSQGYKAGAFAGLSATNASSFDPAHQERLIAYEGGFKTDLIDRTLQLDGAAFYYDYANKQIQGSFVDPIFGDLPKLINIPQSHVVGFELSAIWQPVSGLTITPMVSYAQSRIDGNFYNYDPLGNYVRLSGQQFPGEPELQADLDAEYGWQVTDQVRAFVGGNVNYQGSDNSEVGSVPQLNVPEHTLVDLRAGVEKGPLRMEIWGRNVFNTYYWTTQLHVVDAYTRYAGMPATFGVTLSYKYR